MDNFKWSDQTEEAACLVAESNLSMGAIAAKVGVVYTTLWRWKKHPEFAGRVEEHLARFREDVRRRGVAILEKRVSAVNDRWVRLQQIIEERADHADYAEAPGGKTGLLVKTIKQIGSGENAREVMEFAVDVGLLKELREHEKQAAMELGQWDDRGNNEATKVGDKKVMQALEMFDALESRD
jgi:transposase-like protein